jgi:hypothetical protein
MEGMMKRYVATLAIFATLAVSAASGAFALPVIEKGDLNRHCIAKYQPRGTQAVADPYTAPLNGQLRCRLTSVFGFTNENQSNGEVCLRLTGNAGWTNYGNRVRCGRSAAAPRAPVIRYNVPNRPFLRRCTRWVWNGRAYICR